LSYELRAVVSPADWAALHNIRRATLFAPGRHLIDAAYNDNHPDDRDPANQPFVLMLEREPIGVVRLDWRGVDGGVVRLVAIVPDRQRQGHGRVLDRLVVEEARRRNMHVLHVNAHPNAVGFYDKTGWRREVWDPSELVGLAADCVQMVKGL
jgi:GNAT superfamily N-acetyltransferase